MSNTDRKVFNYLSAKNLNDKYNLLNNRQKLMVANSVKRFHQKITIAIQQAYIFNRIICDDFAIEIKVNKVFNSMY